MASSITYRRLGANNDPVWGTGQASFVADVEAVAQTIGTSLRLLQGEWWENLSLGFPLFQALVGRYGSGKAIDASVMVILTTIRASSPYVSGIVNVSAGYNPITRVFSFSCDVQTPFGTIPVSYTPVGARAALA